MKDLIKLVGLDKQEEQLKKEREEVAAGRRAPKNVIQSICYMQERTWVGVLDVQ